MGMTIAEKILAKKSGRDRVAAGALVTVKVDTVVLFDNNFMPSIWQDMLKMEHPERVVVILDHRVPAPTIQSAGAHRTARKFVEKFKIARFHDVGGTQGICHQVVADQGYALPGTVLVCSDSHTCSAGAFNCIARGVGGPDVMYSAAKGETWFRVGTTVRYEMTGALSKGVTAKDVFLHIAGTYGDHATQNVEFGGSALAGLSMSARKTLSTMGAELSCEFATFEADSVLADYLRACGKKDIEPVSPDSDAKYADVRKIDLSKLEPLVALPDSVLKNSRGISEVAGTRVDQAFIGSCANGTLDDLTLAAQVLAGRKVSPQTRLIITPGSMHVYREALRTGVIAVLAEAGAVITNPTCGACGGGHMGVLGPEEVCITASTRNFKGRMGDPSSKVYMASPATVAASAIKGVITHPGEFLQ
ncbi:MAG: aconitase/3-isopropylmalate dehydratase large subunit family protein [Proteobacteria bacterium]|nr:aconitase/3-isopropylmalate dehydratase large subunit family protein [Pseudomonadota bacterium]